MVTKIGLFLSSPDTGILEKLTPAAMEALCASMTPKGTREPAPARPSPPRL